MTVGEIYERLNTISAFELQEKWDNSGLNVGSFEARASKIVLSIDVTLELASQHEEGTLFIVHHPLIFSGLKQLDFARYPANVIQKLIEKNQSVIAMHTNVDKTHLNRYVFTQVLGLQIDKEDELMLQSRAHFSKEQLYDLVQKKLGLDTFRVVGEKENIKGLALTTGSGSSMMDACEAQCFITGDIKYHDAMKAAQQGLMLIDINHFESERFFGQAIEADLKKNNISAIIANSKNPYTTVHQNGQ